MWLCVQGVWSWIDDDNEDEHERDERRPDRAAGK